MKNSPEEYVEMLINKYTKIQYMAIEEYIPNSIPVLIECAIIDVTNTLDALHDFNLKTRRYSDFKLTVTYKYFIEILTILKSKLNQ